MKKNLDNSVEPELVGGVRAFIDWVAFTGRRVRLGNVKQKEIVVLMKMIINSSVKLNDFSDHIRVLNLKIDRLGELIHTDRIEDSKILNSRIDKIKSLIQQKNKKIKSLDITKHKIKHIKTPVKRGKNIKTWVLTKLIEEAVCNKKANSINNAYRVVKKNNKTNLTQKKYRAIKISLKRRQVIKQISKNSYTWVANNGQSPHPKSKILGCGLSCEA